MPAERVFEAATRLHVTSRRLLIFLESHSLVHSTASSALSSAAARLLDVATTTDVLNESARYFRPRPRRWVRYWYWEDDEDQWGPERYDWDEWCGPDELTTAQAAAAYGVVPATIRQWVRRGHLVPSRREGRTSIFNARAVYGAALAAYERNRQPRGLDHADYFGSKPIAGAGLTGRLMAELVTAEVAARAVDVSPSTIRSWRHRGHLRPVTFQGRTPLYRLSDVVAAARRPSHRPARKPKPLI